MLERLFHYLDERRFLGLQVWEVSYRSLPRAYAWAFFRKAILRHPGHVWRGILDYRRFLRQGRREGDITTLFGEAEEEFLGQMVAEGGLLALGFCQKPREGCPAERANHLCSYLPQLGKEPPLPCRGCNMALLGRKALEAGASLHIMTSAYDIAHDLMMPALERGRLRKVILCLCPFSARAILLPLFICGIQGYLIEYASGNCGDYQEWLLADRGVKRERTTFCPEVYLKIETILDSLAAKRGDKFNYRRFRREGNVYRPVE